MTLNKKKNQQEKNKNYKNLMKLRKKIKETTYTEFLKRPGDKFPPEG